MRHCLQYGDEEICYQVNRVDSRKQKISIHVYPDGTVQVDAPTDADLVGIFDAVRVRARWISKRLEEIRKRNLHVLPREYVSGESYFYLGRRYLLKVNENPGEVGRAKLTGRYLQVFAPTAEQALIKRFVKVWYRARAKELFARRLSELAEQIVWLREMPPVKLLTMRIQWGSCSPSGVVVLNPNLVKAPRECVDYVILHEVCHLKEHNHSHKFYRLLTELMPDWERHKLRLDGLAEALLND
ncbi:MAG: metal-dependent hydrolase [Geobacteraceae bacterium GWC2_53_11]|nr:MAG: metal-dependent hydrolase [Geobacteraceae bacterium GWC2_53_11]